MKKSTKIWILIAGACMGVGILLCIIAMFVAGFQFSKFETTEKKEEKHYTISADNIKNLTVSTAATDVEVRPGSSPDIEITCYENKKEYFDIETVEDSLNITEKNKEKWFHIQINFTSEEEEKLIVEVPEAQYEKLVLDSSSGDIFLDQILCKELSIDTSSGNATVKDCSATDLLQVNTSSGDCALAYVKSKEASVDTTSGEVEITAMQELTKLTIDTSSGDVSLSNVLVSGLVKIDTTSGDLDLERVEADKLQCDTSSGEVEFEELSATAYDMNTTSGDISGTIAENNESVSFTVDTASGEVDIPNPCKGDHTFTADTSSGDVTVRFVEEKRIMEGAEWYEE